MSRLAQPVPGSYGPISAAGDQWGIKIFKIRNFNFKTLHIDILFQAEDQQQNPNPQNPKTLLIQCIIV